MITWNDSYTRLFYCLKMVEIILSNTYFEQTVVAGEVGYATERR